jgi:hypothetical protein
VICFNIRKKRIFFIKSYKFPPGIKEKIKVKYPHLTDAELSTVLDGLKSFFIISLKAKGRMVAMPSQVIDFAWHEFILFTRTYQQFCKKGLGKFLHHTPSEVMQSQTQAQEGIKRAWRLACDQEQINVKKPKKLPLLFAIDGDFKIEGGYIYSKNCKDKNTPNFGRDYCASHIGCSSGCSGSSGGVSDSDSSCSSSSCGSGCGGGD